MQGKERILRCAALPADSGLELAAFLAARFPYHGREGWAALAAAGALLVNGAAAGAGLVLCAGDEVRYVPPPRPEPPVDLSVGVLYEDADIMLVNKPGNLPAHPAGRYFNNTLWRVLKDRLGVPEPSIINRLDRETSGVVLVARHGRAADICRRQFDARAVTKKYTVFAEGDFPGPLRARGYIAPAAGAAVRKKMAFTRSALAAPEPGAESRWADTEFLPVERRGGFTVLEALPHTGRLHQLRATLLALGFPVTGDKVYGADETVFLRFLEDGLTAGDRARLRLPRQALHAAELSFRHPADGRPMTVRAPLPADMACLLAGAGGPLTKKPFPVIL